MTIAENEVAVLAATADHPDDFQVKVAETPSACVFSSDATDPLIETMAPITNGEMAIEVFDASTTEGDEGGIPVTAIAVPVIATNVTCAETNIALAATNVTLAATCIKEVSSGNDWNVPSDEETADAIAVVSAWLFTADDIVIVWLFASS